MDSEKETLESLIVGAVARGYTHETTKNMVLNAALCMAIAAEILALIPVILLEHGLELDITTGKVTHAN